MSEGLESGSSSKISCLKFESSDVGLQLELLPASILETILSKLDFRSICSVSATCTAFKSCVRDLLPFLPDLNILDVSLSVENLRFLLARNCQFRALKLSCGYMNDSAIPLVARPSLQELFLTRCDKFSWRLFSKIGANCRNLRSLSLYGVGRRTEFPANAKDLEKLFIGCPQLESLVLQMDFLRLDGADEFGSIWALSPRKLTVLKLAFITLEMMTEVFNVKVESHQSPCHMKTSPFHCLQKLQLCLVTITDDFIATLSRVLTSLTHLDLEDEPFIEPEIRWDLTNAGLQQINPNGKLKHLSLFRGRGSMMLTQFRRVNDQGMLLMAERCSKLESICLGGFCCITDVGIRAFLHSCSNLQKLMVYPGSQLTDLVFHDMSATPLSLKYVGLGRCLHLRNFAFMQLACNKNLISLDLKNCSYLGDVSLKSIGGLSKLKILVLDGSQISDVGISYLAHGLASLISFSVRGCKRLTNKCISLIFESSLGSRLQVLDLSDISNLSDGGILSLAKSGVPLNDFRIRNCNQVGDTSVIALASMQARGGWCGSTLQMLDLYGCGFTSLAFEWLKEPYFPRLRKLGLSTNVHRNMVHNLERKRPRLQIFADYGELEQYFDSESFPGYEYELDEQENSWCDSDEDVDVVEMLADYYT